MEDIRPGELTPEAAAARLGIDVRELRRASNAGRVPVARRTLGGHRRYSTEAIDRIKQQMEGSEADEQ